MIRHCDGTDPNLTQEILAGDFHEATMTVSPWDRMAREGRRVINCQCGLRFDDTDYLVIYPHQPDMGGAHLTNRVLRRLRAFF